MKILRISSSINGQNSLSFKLGNTIIERIKSQLQVTQVIERDLAVKEIPHLNRWQFSSYLAQPENQTEEARYAQLISAEAMRELLDSDILVIEAPMYNFTIPSSLKAWIDHILQAGSTFRYTPNGVEGLVKGKKAYLAIASGGIYSEGPLKEIDLTEKYLMHVLGFIGITDVKTFRVEGTAIPELKEKAFPKAIDTVLAHTF